MSVEAQHLDLSLGNKSGYYNAANTQFVLLSSSIQRREKSDGNMHDIPTWLILGSAINPA